MQTGHRQAGAKQFSHTWIIGCAAHPRNRLAKLTIPPTLPRTCDRSPAVRMGLHSCTRSTVRCSRYFYCLTLPYWLLQMMRHGKYRAGLRQRFGAVPPHLLKLGGERTIWVHAVSVGEVIAASAVVEALRAEFPSHRVLVSTTTSTGQKLAAKKFGDDSVFYFPLDFASSMRPYFEALRPRLCVIAETEFWPNFLRLAKRSGARVAVINCRISDRSLPGYRRLRFWLPKVLSNVDLFLAQTEEDRRRLVEIGASPARAQVAGNLKFDVAAPPMPSVAASLRARFDEWGAGPILVCGSTLDEEEGFCSRHSATFWRRIRRR